MARTDETISKQSTCFLRPEGEAQEKSTIKKGKGKKKKKKKLTRNSPWSWPGFMYVFLVYKGIWLSFHWILPNAVVTLLILWSACSQKASSLPDLFQTWIKSCVKNTGAAQWKSERNANFGIRETWFQALVLPFSSCVAWNKSLYLFEAQIFHL